MTGVQTCALPISIYDVFETADDKPVFIGVVTDSLWEKFCALFGLDALWADETLRLNNHRVLARDRIMPVVRALVKTFTRDAVIATLDGTGLPFAPIGRPEDMFDDPHLLASGGLETVTLDDGRIAYLPPLPLEMDGVRVNADAELPVPGRDSDAVLAGLGYDAAAIAGLRESGAVG